MRVLLLLTCLFLISHITHADVYMEKDNNGDFVYSDAPEGANAKRIDLPNDVQAASNQSGAPTTSTVKRKTINTSPINEINKPYTLFAISSPKDQESIQNQPTLSVSILVDPALQEGDVIQLYLDGSPWDKPAKSNHFTFTVPARGTHTLSAKLLDKNGRVLKVSPTFTIYVHQAHIGSPAVT